MSYTLKRDGWHWKLQRWIFRDVDRMGNMCPYFWLTNFCIMVAPFVALYRMLAWMFAKFCMPFEYAFDTIAYSTYKADQNTKPIMDNRQAYRVFNLLYGWHYWYDQNLDSLVENYASKITPDVRKRLKAKLKDWQDENPGWEDFILEGRALTLRSIERVEQEAKDRKEKFYKVAQYTKSLLLLPLGIALIYIAYGIGLLAIWGMENPDTFLAVLLGVSIWIGGIVLATAIIIFIRNTANKEIPIPQPVRRAGCVIKEAFLFFWINVKLLYKNYCPQIEWED